MSADICGLSAIELAAMIRSAQLSSAEATEAALSRLEASDESLCAFEYVDDAGAMECAHVADARLASNVEIGPLHGVPVSVKDLIDVAGMPCRYGSRTVSNDPVGRDSPSVARLRDAGAVIIGKTTTSELGYRGYTTRLDGKPTRNPCDLSRTSGGSSGGAVASIAAGVTSIGLGTDGGGSIRAPCSLNGLVGIKATFGRVPVWPVSATPTIAHVGPIARSVDDAALLLRVIAGKHPLDRFSQYPPMQHADSTADLADLRVGYFPSLGYGRVQPGVAAAVDAAICKLESLFGSIEMETDAFPDPSPIFITEFMGGCSARLGDLVDSAPHLIDPNLLRAVLNVRHKPAASVFLLQRQRALHYEAVASLFKRYHLLLMPTTPCVAWPIESFSPPDLPGFAAWSFFTYPFNLSHHPAGTLPCGTDEATGMPIGLQFVAPLLGEELLVTALRAAEEALAAGFGRPVEPVVRPHEDINQHA